MPALAILTRSDIIESIHYGDICITSPDKSIINLLGNPDMRIYLRSAAKPFQAVALVSSGAIEKFDISLEELAIICSSHSGEDFHRKTVASILDKIGLSEDNLNCGVANPYNQDMINQLIKKGERPSQLYNCCSGKHVGMLALCRYNNYPIEGYVEFDHPLQQLMIKTISELLECKKEDIGIGIDGCGLPTFNISLKQTSYLYALLAQGYNAFALIQKAMTSYPRMINGDREFCTDLITHSEGKVIGKVGAEGVYCVAVPREKLGICIKITDGNERAVYPVAISILSKLGILDNGAIKKLKNWAYPPLKNHKGSTIGYTIPVFSFNNENVDLKIGDKYEFNNGTIGSCN